MAEVSKNGPMTPPSSTLSSNIDFLRYFRTFSPPQADLGKPSFRGENGSSDAGHRFSVGTGSAVDSDTIAIGSERVPTLTLRKSQNDKRDAEKRLGVVAKPPRCRAAYVRRNHNRPSRARHRPAQGSSWPYAGDDRSCKQGYGRDLAEGLARPWTGKPPPLERATLG